MHHIQVAGFLSLVCTTFCSFNGVAEGRLYKLWQINVNVIHSKTGRLGCCLVNVHLINLILVNLDLRCLVQVTCGGKCQWAAFVISNIYIVIMNIGSYFLLLCSVFGLNCLHFPRQQRAIVDLKLFNFSVEL